MKNSILKGFCFLFVLAISLAFTPKTDNDTSDDVTIIKSTNKDGSQKTFDEILSQFKGKVVYVDFWASWCGPCIGQFSYSKQLHANLKGKDVVFLYVSLDQNPKAWENAVNKFKNPGYHVLLEGNLKNTVSQQFQINTIPRYLIINKKGVVVDKNAERPSSSTIQSTLLSHAK